VRRAALCFALAIATSACGSESQQALHAAASTPTPAPSTVPSDWQRVTAYDITIPLPPGWEKSLDTAGKSDRPDADPPQILQFVEKGANSARAPSLSIWLWGRSSVDDLVRTRFVDGNLSFVSQARVPAARDVREVIGRASWSGPQGAGTYLARHLFAQVDADRVLDVITYGAPIPGTETEPSPDMRLIQEIIVHNVQSRPGVACPRARSTDAFGVITSDGATGIMDRTYGSASAVALGDAFMMVRRGSVVGQKVAAEFRQIGTSAPATWVAYTVTAEARPTPAGVRATPWDGAAFKLGVKPIGFADSCWRLIVDGVDTSIVLQVGP
jgi:hypothetical protein